MSAYQATNGNPKGKPQELIMFNCELHDIVRYLFEKGLVHVSFIYKIGDSNLHFEPYSLNFLPKIYLLTSVHFSCLWLAALESSHVTYSWQEFNRNRQNFKVR